MRKYYVKIAVCSLLLTTLSVFVGVTQEQKTAAQLWVDYLGANQNAIASSTNYNTHVDAAREVKEQLDANEDTVDASTRSTLQNVFVAGGLYALGAPTIFIPALGQVKPTLDMINSWLEAGDLEKLKDFAEQAASDAHRKAVQREQEKNQAYTDYTTQYQDENPGSDPKPPLDDVDHKVYNFECNGGCGTSWDNVESARITHRKTCPDASASPAGCDKPYYSCTDTSHNEVTCTNFIGYTCGVSFRECSNSQCTPSGSLWSLTFKHSGRGTRPSETLESGSNICPKCGKSHGSGL